MTGQINEPYLPPREAFILFGKHSLHKKDITDFMSAVSMLTPREVYSLTAVADCLKVLSAIGENECVKALYEIYFSLNDRAIKKAPITAAVRRFAYESYLDERTVYRRLARASKIYTAITKNRTASHLREAACFLSA